MRIYLVFMLVGLFAQVGLYGQDKVSKWKYFVEGRHFINPVINKGDNFLTGIGLTAKLAAGSRHKTTVAGMSYIFSGQYYSNYDLNVLKVEGYSFAALLNQDFRVFKSSDKFYWFISGGGEFHAINTQEQWRHHFAAAAQLGFSYKNQSSLIKGIDLGLTNSFFIGSVSDRSFPILSGVFLRIMIWQ